MRLLYGIDCITLRLQVPHGVNRLGVVLPVDALFGA